MPQKPKLETVAKRAGVSLATASQVMRGVGRISEATRKKVQKAAQDLHYLPDGRAAAMRSGQNREIGFVINQIANPFNAEVISGVSDLLEAEGYLLSVLDARDDADRQRRQIEAFIRGGRGGLLWVPALGAGPCTLGLLARQKIPTVTFLRQPAGGEVALDHLGIRNAEATALAAAHLCDLGHQNIAYLGGREMTDVRRDRIEGCRRVLDRRGLAPPVLWDCLDTKPAGFAAMSALLRRHPDVTAVICNGDMVALGACLALPRLGLVAGRDVSVTGFDDIPDAALAHPPLTTLSVSPYQLGRRLARMLLERIAEPEMPVALSEIPARLIARDTTGPCRPRPPL